jgi:ubiquinone/menaquinone biosynthesis C-methylase UbiE
VTAQTPDFDARAATYDALRPPGQAWWRLFEVLVEEGDLRGRKVLDVGCGTGKLLAALVERAHARAWGVDSSEELSVARRPPGRWASTWGAPRRSRSATGGSNV